MILLLLLFWLDLFLEARAEILSKKLLVFWSIWRHQKDILKLTDLYAFLFSDSDNTESDKYILQVAGINEYLQNDSLLQDYVYVHECYKFDRDVEFIVLLRDNNLKTLARTADDDQIDAKVTVNN